VSGGLRLRLEFTLTFGLAKQADCCHDADFLGNESFMAAVQAPTSTAEKEVHLIRDTAPSDTMTCMGVRRNGAVAHPGPFS
jgi:hypothetical protein